MIYPLVRGLSGFRWSSENRRTGLLFVVTIALTHYGFVALPAGFATALGTLLTLMSGIYAFRALAYLLPSEKVPLPLRRLLRRQKVGGQPSRRA